MQIHEITQVNEGVGNFLGNIAGRVSSGIGAMGQKLSPMGDFKSARNSQLQAGQVAMLAKKVTEIWANYVKQLKVATPDAARFDTLYTQTLTAFVQKNLLAGQSINNATNRQEINQLIAGISDAKDNPGQVAQLMTKLVQQAALSQQDVTQGQTLTKVVSTEPAVIQYRNINYAVNDSGSWANQVTGKVPDESFQAFLDQELNKAGGSAPTPSAPIAGTQPAPRRVSRTRGGQ
jgi:hypothetical protein